MLITQLKSKETIASLLKGNTVIINCLGCKEVHFPEEEAYALQAELSEDKTIAATVTTDYICQPDHLALQLKKHQDTLEDADSIMVFSCGVGVQTVAKAYPDMRVYSACDTFPLPGFQGVTPLEFDCGQCGECYLNYTGGICPITACSKGLVNGQCGGAKDGKCEVDKDMDCGWELIYR
ncbi:MAG TPA: 5,10-methylene tetrahydromethanopterin reductase, partial [Eubacteriaceae bacterium]|nr:5,10-methylene tetrahydromethanopterin reductase [Eubacteriaceae bacterium]